MARTSIVIPNYNGLQHLPECLETLTTRPLNDAEIVLVDNASVDGSLDFVRNHYPMVRVVALVDNGGFSAAVNAGIAATAGEYIVLLNNDTSVEHGWVDRLVEAMDTTPEAGFGAAKLVRYDDPRLIDAAGDGFIPHKLSGTTIGSGKPASEYDQRSWVFGACAAAAIYRRAMFNEIGVFDEDFFLTHEDVDISMRAQLAGYRCVYVPDAVVRHKRRVSYDLATPEMQAIGLRNRIWVVGKNAPIPLLLRWIAGGTPHTIRMIVQKVVAHGSSDPAQENARPEWTLALIRSVFLPEVWRAIRTLPTKRRALRGTRRAGATALVHSIRNPHEPLTKDRSYHAPSGSWEP